MSEQHTPGHTLGPWMDCGEGRLKHPVTGGPVATRVVEAKGWGRIFEVFDYSNESDANFRLIIAAPELLTALEAATNALAIESINRFGNRHFETAKAIETIIAEARAAIAKAKGEAS